MERTSKFKMNAPTAPLMGFSFSEVARRSRTGLSSARLQARTHDDSSLSRVRQAYMALRYLSPAMQHLRLSH